MLTLIRRASNHRMDLLSLTLPIFPLRVFKHAPPQLWIRASHFFLFSLLIPPQFLSGYRRIKNHFDQWSRQASPPETTATTTRLICRVRVFTRTQSLMNTRAGTHGETHGIYHHIITMYSALDTSSLVHSTIHIT